MGLEDNFKEFADRLIDIGIKSGKTSDNLAEDFSLSEEDREPLYRLLKARNDGNPIILDRQFRKLTIIGYIQGINYARGGYRH